MGDQVLHVNDNDRPKSTA